MVPSLVLSPVGLGETSVVVSPDRHNWLIHSAFVRRDYTLCQVRNGQFFFLFFFFFASLILPFEIPSQQKLISEQTAAGGGAVSEYATFVTGAGGRSDFYFLFCFILFLFYFIFSLKGSTS